MDEAYKYLDRFIENCDVKYILNYYSPNDILIRWENFFGESQIIYSTYTKQVTIESSTIYRSLLGEYALCRIEINELVKKYFNRNLNIQIDNVKIHYFYKSH